MSIGDNIRRIRKEKGWTQAQLAKILSVSQQMVGQFEKSKKPPKLETVEKIASALGVTAFDLMGFEYWDKKYPDIAQHSKEYEGFVDYLNALGYIVQDVYSKEQIPVEKFDEIGKSELVSEESRQSGFVVGESHCLELIKDGASVVLEDHEFSQLIESTKDMIAWELWRKAKKNKPLPAKRKTT